MSQIKVMDVVEGNKPQVRSVAQKVYNTVHCLKVGRDKNNVLKLYYLPEWRSQK